MYVPQSTGFENCLGNSATAVCVGNIQLKATICNIGKQILVSD
jgi:hypothetical protein